MTLNIINSAGLILDIIGALLIWRFGLPEKIDRDGDMNIACEQIDKTEKTKAKKHDCLAHIGVILLIVGFVLQLASNLLRANNYTISTTNNSGPNSLRAVLTLANGATGSHTLSFGTTGNFAGGGTINLVSPLPQITQSVTITGWLNGGSSNAISVNGSPLVFAIGTIGSLQQNDQYKRQPIETSCDAL